VGDIVTAVDGGPVTDESGLNFRVATKRAGEEVVLQVLREGRAQTLRARVEPPPASPARDERTIAGGNPLSGATVVNLSPAVADELGVDPFLARGVLVTQITSRGYAATAGFRPGDIVRAINGRQIDTTRDLESLMRERVPGWRITIQRGGREITGEFRA
jgi:S1-C subfamily serine protease